MGYVVALTGGIGSGKSAVASEFAALGVTVVDADQIARELVTPGQPALAEIVRHFGKRLLQQDGSLNRAKLRTLIFANPGEKAWLEALLHPLIRQRTRALLAAVSGGYGLWVVPLLLENGLQGEADRVLVVDVPPKTQIVRTVQRDGVSRAQVARILASQLARNTRLAHADDIIDNTGSRQATQAQVYRLHNVYQRLAAEHG